MPSSGAPVPGRAAVVAAMVLAVAAAPLVQGEPAGVTLEGEIPANSWVAIRFNVTPDHDLRAFGVLRTYHDDEPRSGGGTFMIRDGAAQPTSFGPAGLHAWVSTEVAHVSTPHGRVGVTPGLLTSGGGEGGYLFGHGGYYAFNDSITWVGIYRDARAFYSVNVTWSQGVTSWDVATGPAMVLYPDEMESGVHAGAHFLFAAASAGGAISEQHTTQRDTIGWFLPDIPETSGTAVWDCRRDGTPCDPWSTQGGWFNARKVVSKGPTDWRFDIHATVEADNPILTLGVAELPDDTYLAE